MRHFLFLAGAVIALSAGMVELALAASLITTRRLSLVPAPGLFGTIVAAIALTTVARTAGQSRTSAQRTPE